MRLTGFLRRSRNLSPAAAFWRRRAWVTAGRWNGAAWLGSFLPLAVGCALAGMVALLLLRRGGGNLETAWVGLGVALFFTAVGAGGGGWGVGGGAFFSGGGGGGGGVWRRGGWFSLAEALVRLEAAMGLRNRLSSAAAGIGPWPKPRRAVADGLEWKWPRVLGALALGAGLLLFGQFVKLPAAAPVWAGARDEPPAWTETAALLTDLEKTSVAQPEAIAELQQRLQELRDRDEAQWYAHSSLEAGDHLHAETKSGVTQLAQQLGTAADVLAKLDQPADQLSDDEKAKLGKELAGAVSGLEMGTLPLNHETLQQLKVVDPKDLKSLTPQQLAQLQQALREQANHAAQCVGGNPGDGDLPMLADADGADADLATGAPTHGGGTVPLNLKRDETDLGTTKTEALPGESMEHASLGEIEGVSVGKHEIDPKAFTGPQAAGAVSATGAGGDAVWRNDLSPAERELLQKVFK